MSSGGAKPPKFYELKAQNDGIVDSGIMKVIVTFLRAPNNQPELVEYLDDIEVIYSKNRPFLILYDAVRVAKAPSKDVLEQLSEYMNKRESSTKRFVLGCSICIDSSSLMGMGLLALVKSILFVRKPACPTAFFDNVTDAQTYLAKHNPEMRAAAAAVAATAPKPKPNPKPRQIHL